MKNLTTTNEYHLNSSFCFEIKHIPLKRIFDVLFSLIALIFLLPLMTLISIAIYSTSPGKTVYSQIRIGRGGKPFRCYKFRTMHCDAEMRLEEILRADPQKKTEWEQTHKLKNDPRIFPLGKFLRRTSLDELPQFWNVLKGDLSIVGPRPVVSEEITKHFGIKANKIFSIRPGITGLWQVSGRNDIDYIQRIALDELYVDTRNMLLDLKVIVKTIPSMLFAKGAY